MDSYVARGFTFPDQEWWEEKKADVSYLYENADESDSVNLSTDGMAEDLGCEDVQVKWSESHRVSKHLSMKESASRTMPLGTWIEQSRQEKPVPSKPTITALAGYINLAYPILRSLGDEGSNQRPPKKVNTKELQDKMKNIRNNLQHVVNTLCSVQTELESRRFPSDQESKLKEYLRRKSLRIVENCELMNVLLNLVQNTAQIPMTRSEMEEINKTYGSSVNII